MTFQPPSQQKTHLMKTLVLIASGILSGVSASNCPRDVEPLLRIALLRHPHLDLQEPFSKRLFKKKKKRSSHLGFFPAILASQIGFFQTISVHSGESVFSPTVKSVLPFLRGACCPESMCRGPDAVEQGLCSLEEEEQLWNQVLGEGERHFYKAFKSRQATL